MFADSLDTLDTLWYCGYSLILYVVDWYLIMCGFLVTCLLLFTLCVTFDDTLCIDDLIRYAMVFLKFICDDVFPWYYVYDDMFSVSWWKDGVVPLVREHPATPLLPFMVCFQWRLYVTWRLSVCRNCRIKSLDSTCFSRTGQAQNEPNGYDVVKKELLRKSSHPKFVFSLGGSWVMLRPGFVLVFWFSELNDLFNLFILCSSDKLKLFY